MNKKIIGILLCMLMLATTIPIVAGGNTDTVAPAGPFSKTTVRGFILGSRTEGMVTSFFAILVHYTTSSLIAEDVSGVIILQRVSFVGKFTGHMGRLYISGMFRGTV